MLRCGSSARPSFAALPDQRNFDVAANYYAAPHPEDGLHTQSEFLIAGGLSKYHAAKQFLYSGFLHKYQGIAFLDEDVELHFDLSDYLLYCQAQGFDLCQPALTAASDGAWNITFRHPGFEYRLTNFVEVMAPYMSQRFLMSVVDSFDVSISTYGLDVLWGAQLEPDQRAAVIDRYLMTHAKPRDFHQGAYYAYLRSLGIDPLHELKNVLETLQLECYEIRFKGGMEIVQTVRVASR